MKLANRSLRRQARDVIFELIKKEFGSMERIPSEQKLAEMFGVSRNTVREAIRTLEQEGVVVSRHGVGTFVVGSGESLQSNIASLGSTTSLIRDHGYQPGTEKVLSELRTTTPEVAKKLALTEVADVLYIERVRTADGEPVIYLENHVAYTRGMEEDYRRNTPESLFEFLERYGSEVSFSLCHMQAVISDEKTEDKLSLPEKRALLLLKQIHYSTKGQPIFYSDGYYLSDKLEFNVVRKRA